MLPDLHEASVFEDIKKNGMEAAMKYYQAGKKHSELENEEHSWEDAKQKPTNNSSDFLGGGFNFFKFSSVTWGNDPIWPAYETTNPGGILVKTIQAKLLEDPQLSEKGRGPYVED